MSADSLTGVWGVARRQRAERNTGDPGLRGVAPFAPSSGGGQRWGSEGSIVPRASLGQQNRGRGKGPWFGVGLSEARGGRVA
jgi:hypothetical protein